MQQKFILWRASNPIFFICCYFLIGFLAFKSSKHYWPILAQTTLLVLVSISCIVVCIMHVFRHKAHVLKLVPTIFLLFWGALVAQYHSSSSFLSEMVSAHWVVEVRQYFISKIDHAFADPESNAFAKSLLFGTKSDMSPTLKTAYQQLGILHIIAISGMHLDILFKL